MSANAPLPAGWRWTTLGEIRIDKSRSIEPAKTPDKNFELFSVPSHATGQPELQTGSQIGSNKRTVEPDTVLLCKINPHINRVWKVKRHSDYELIASTEWIPFFPVSGVDPDYLMYFLSLNVVRDHLTQNASGVGGSLMRARPALLEGFPFPLAPLAEQQRIVDAIETHFTRLDAAEASLRRAKANLKRYRASLLTAATTGRLVPTEAALARAEGRSYEPAATLLARILDERRTRWQAANPRKPYPEPPAPDLSTLPPLPEGWTWATVAQIGEVATGATPLRSRNAYYKNGTVPWVTSAVVNLPLVVEPSEYITELALVETNTKVFPPGTLLLAMYGEGKTRGAVTELGIAAATNQALAAILLDETAVPLRPYLRLYLEKTYDDIRRQSSGGVQPNLNLSIVRSFCVPIPPLPEQARIADELESKLSLIESTDSLSDMDFRRAARLRQAILQRAFSGQLVC